MKLNDLRFRYPRGNGFELGPLDLEGPDERPWLILGGTGSGKTTLLRLLGANLEPRSGEVEGFRPGEISAYLPQLPERAMAGRNLAEDLSGNLRPPRVERSRLRQALRESGLEGVPLSRRSHDLSLGERRRVALSLLLLSRAAHWALDEPDAGLDRPGLESLIRLLEDHIEAGHGRIWIATHRFELYGCLSPWCVVLDHGRILAHGNLREIMTLPSVTASLGITNRAPFLLWEGLRKRVGKDALGGLPGPPPEGVRLAQVHALLMDRTGF
jgi:energy-coupling factor transporter ATP-binding protein EcfA2